MTLFNLSIVPKNRRKLLETKEDGKGSLDTLQKLLQEPVINNEENLIAIFEYKYCVSIFRMFTLLFTSSLALSFSGCCRNSSDNHGHAFDTWKEPSDACFFGAPEKYSGIGPVFETFS